MKPGKHQRSEQRCQHLCWEVHDRAQSSVLRSYTIFMSYVTKTFLLVTVPASVSSKQLMAKKENKNIQQTTFVEFCNHSSLLTMVQPRDCLG